MIWFGEEFFFVQTSGDITFFSDIQDGVSLFRSIISLITIIFFSVGNSPPPPRYFIVRIFYPRNQSAKYFFLKFAIPSLLKSQLVGGLGWWWGGGGGGGARSGTEFT